MQLPPRDGVHQRYYLIHKPDTDPEVLKQADQCITSSSRWRPSTLLLDSQT